MYKLDEETIWEDTGEIRVHNFPSRKGTSSYVTKVYREIKKGTLGWKLVEGNPLYYHEMSVDQNVLASIISTASGRLVDSIGLGGDQFLNELLWNPETGYDSDKTE